MYISHIQINPYHARNIAQTKCKIKRDFVSGNRLLLFYILFSQRKSCMRFSLENLPEHANKWDEIYMKRDQLHNNLVLVLFITYDRPQFSYVTSPAH